MLAFEWNALRVGDRVAVHDDAAPHLSLGGGVVALVRTQRPAVNDVGIRLDAPGSGIVRPSRHAVHLVPVRRSGCWRCDESGSAPGDPAVPT